MNDNKTFRKRKTSFANDRLKRLRTSLNNEVVTSSTSNISKPDLTPSVKNNIQNNARGYPERKKLVPVRKLKNIGREGNQQNYKRIEQNVDSGVFIVKKPTLSEYVCTPERQKNFKGSISATSSTTTVEKYVTHLNTPIPKCSNVTKKLSNILNKNKNSINSVSSKSSIQNPPKRKMEKFSDGNKTSSLADQKTPKERSESVEKTSLAYSGLAKLTNNVPNFSDICSTKTKFEYQHVSNVQTAQGSINSKDDDYSCSSVNSQNYIGYFGQAMNSLYSNLFDSGQNAHENQPENKVANRDSMDWEPDDDEHPSNVAERDKEKSDRELYIIVDTNIFLDSLSFLEGIVKYGSDEGVKPVIYVPWMVFNELDFIKDNRSSGMRSEASKAIDFINKMLTNRRKKLIGQSIFEANKQMYVGKSPDDKITSCCLQVKEKGYKAVLLSNDKNLRNKLIINGIPSLSCSDLLKSFNDISPHTDKMKMLLEEMKKCCTDIISDCCEEAYGSVWNKLALLDKQPWSFEACLEIFKKYWSAVFREKLLKQFLKSVEKMSLILKNSESLRDPETFENFAKDCLSLCFFLMDLDQHKDHIAGTIKKVNMMLGLKS